MLPQKHILILTSKTGGGHVSLARAMSDLLTSSDQPQTINHPAISIVDPQPRLFHWHYRLVSRYALWLWAAEFRFLDTSSRSLHAHQAFGRLMRQRLQALLDRVQPDLIITTYPFLTCEVTRILEQRSSTVPLIMLFSDANSVHASWLTERRASATFATTRETYHQALSVGCVPECLHLVGWPVRTQFLQTGLSDPAHVREVRSRLHLVSDRFTVFVQGGGEGSARIASTVENIFSGNKRKQEVQVIVAAGTNRNLLARYQHVPNVVALPYTDHIAPYMAASDIIMGKAGPNILFESVMLGKPFLATTYIPGQEQENLAFILRHGFGWVALQQQEQRALLFKLLDDPSQYSTLLPTISAYREWNRTVIQQIPRLIHQLII